MGTDANKLDTWKQLFGQLFEGSPAQVVLLDLNGVILQTNKAWQEYGRTHGLRPDYEPVGQNYVKVCEAAAGRGDAIAMQAYIGLLEVLRTQRPKFTMVYPCHSPTQKRWYRMWVEPQSPQVPVIVVAHYLQSTQAICSPHDQSSFGIGPDQGTTTDAKAHEAGSGLQISWRTGPAS